MEKVELRTADIAAENAAKLAELFPDIVTEVLDEDGNVRHSIDVEALKAHMGDVAEDKRERYQFTWPGKQKARAEAIRAIDKTMRPCPAESVNWDTTENLYIEGDNLDALKILRETYAGKIKMIYIDPPYNTGHDFVYNDDFARSAEEERAESGAFDEEGNVLDAAYKVNNESNGKFHSDWCSMMYPRLVLARDLLAGDGAIFISIDSGEYDTLKKICDEVFSSENYRNQLLTRRRIKSLNVQFAERGLNSYNVGFEYVLVYSKTPEFSFVPLRMKKKEAKQTGTWNVFWSNADRPTMRYELLGFTPSTGQWRWQESVASEAVANYKSYLEVAGNVTLEEYWRSTGEDKRFIRRIEDGRGKNGGVQYWVPPSDTSLRTSNWTDIEVSQIAKDFDLPFDNPKNVTLIKELISSVPHHDAIILDFFSGSATTAHAVMQLNAEDGGNRKFIMVQLPEVCDEKSEAAKAGYKNICEIGKERIRRAGAKIAAEVEESNAQLKLGEEPKRVPDIGFRVLKIDSSNFEDVQRTPDTLFQDALFGLADNVKPGRTPEDILFQLFPKLEIPYTAHIDTFDICGKTVYSVDDDTLVACFDREVPEDVVRAMAQREPAWAVLRDASFTGDDALANFEEIFKTLSPETKTRVV